MRLEDEIKRVAKLVDSKISSELTGQPHLLYDASSHLIQAGGKRLRPLILLKFHSLYSDDEASAVPAAAAIEMVHNFTLIHDDIMDNDDMRRGVPTTHRMFGVPMAILAGDVLFAKVFKLLSETPSLSADSSRVRKAISEVASSLVTICEGQALDLNPPSLQDFTEQFYLDMIRRKTSALFEASAVVGCLSGGAPEEDIQKARIYATHLGLAFQIVDDLLGILGDPKVTGKPVGGDIRQGKRTLPMIMALKFAGEEQQKSILSIWGVRDARQEDLESVIQFIKSSGVEVEARKIAKKYLDTALSALDSLPSGDARNTLAELADFLTVRRM